MAALTAKTAGVAKKLFMTGVYPNGNKVKAGKMEDAYNKLMNSTAWRKHNIHMHGRSRTSYTSGQWSSASTT